MSFSRFFQNISATGSSALEWMNSSSYSNGTDPEESHGINLTSQPAIIGIACIAASMVIVTSFFCWRAKLSKTTDLKLRVIIKKADADSRGDMLVNRDLSIEYPITPDDHILIGNEGLRNFIKNKIREIIDERIEKNQTIDRNSSLDQVLEVMTGQKNAATKLDKHDLEEILEFSVNRNTKRCNIFSRVLPPLTRATIVFEIVFGTIQRIGALQLSAGILPISRDANNKLAIVQSVISAIFILILMLGGPSQTFMRDFGAAMDDFFHHWIYGKHVNSDSQSTTAETVLSTKIKIRLAQTLLVVFLINNLFTEVMSDYQSMISLNQRVNAQNDAIIPSWAVFICSMIEFSLNQLNDPIELISLTYIGTKIIDAYFSKKLALKSSVHIEEMKEDEEDVEFLSSRNPLRVTTSIAGSHHLPVLGQFSSRQRSATSSPVSQEMLALVEPFLSPKVASAV